MIGTDEMSSTGMDISESFRPEDISKNDFFDFLTAPDMGIDIVDDVSVSLHTSHHHAQHQHAHHHHQQQQQQQQHAQTHNATHSHERTTTTTNSMTHDGGGGGGGPDSVGGSDNSINNGNTSDPTLQSYEFWHTDKEHSRLESTIFEDLDRYCCWQQQQATTTTTAQHHSPAAAVSQNPTSPNHQQQQQLSGSTHTNTACSNANLNAASPNTSASLSQSAVSTIENTDGQIYTITVLNGNEPWLKRETDTQLPSALDFNSLLGNFPGYIKSEYPYDDSGFSTDGTKDVNGDVNGISNLTTQHSMSNIASGQSLPSLVTAISLPSGGAGGGGVGSNSNVDGIGNGSNATSLGQQLAQFQNNNNDWHMVDHNAEQNSAESLLRSALQGKGYTKGLHMQNGITLLPTSPTVKDEDMRRILFSADADSLGFADSSLNATNIFEDSPNSQHTSNAHLLVPPPQQRQQQHTHTTATTANGNVAGMPSIIVNDMFLSLENSFSDDFEKIKRIANEVQQFCSTPGEANDYVSSDVMMQQISPQMQQLHSPAAAATTPTGIGGIPTVVTATATPSTQTTASALRMQHNVSKAVAAAQQQRQQPPQPLKPEVTTSTATSRQTAANPGLVGSTTKNAKKYKRATSITHHNNNNNPNVINHNNNNNSSNNNNNNSNSNVNSVNVAVNNSCGGSSSSNSSNSPTQCNGQRKERSLHYCSICSKGFKDKYSVNVHIRTHTGEKPFACSLCGKSFRQKAHLAKHYQTHMAQKNNGSIVKGGGAKHHRNTTAANTNIGSSSAGGGGVGVVTTAMVQQQHRQLSAMPTTIAAIGSINASISSSSGGGGNNNNTSSGNSSGLINIGGIPMNMVAAATASAQSPTSLTTILPPANGLLANR